MRQIGTINNEPDALRFAAFLTASGTDTRAEEDRGTWAIWVQDENRLDTAKAELIKFQADPNNARYRDAERAAVARRREAEQHRDQVQRNVVYMRGRWGRGGTSARRCPLTIALILLSVFVAVVTSMGTQRTGVMSQLAFCRISPAGPAMPGEDRGVLVPKDGLTQIKQGQLWRLITPIFLHFSISHLVFNMIWLYYLGSQIEDRRGTWRLGLMVLAIAVASNLGQYAWSGHPIFGGMSGVGYGLFGFVWVRMMFDRNSGFFISPLNIFIMVAWFVLCLAGELPQLSKTLEPIVGNVANTAHAVGLLLGLGIGYLPVALKRRG